MVMQLKELSCPNCGSSLTQNDPSSQTIICSVCGSHVAIGVGEPQKISDGGKIGKPPKPIQLGDRATLKGIEYVVLGRVDYEGWDAEEKWYWTEWLLGAKDGRYFWLSYDDESGFSIYHKVRINSAFNPISDSRIPTMTGLGYANVKERYPARIRGAEGELTWRAEANAPLRAVEAAGNGRLYSIQMTEAEIEMYEGVALDEDNVAQAFGNKKWRRMAKARQDRQFVMAFAGGLAMILALVGLLLGVIFGQTGDKIAAESFTLNSANPQGAFTADFDTTRPARVVMKIGNLPLNTWAEVDLSVIDPNDAEGVDVMYEEYWHETGTDEDGRWEEADYSGTGRFLPATTGPHQIKVDLGQTSAGVQNVGVTVEVYENHFLPQWMYIFGGLSGISGLGLLAFSHPRTSGNFIQALMED